jgi:isocitrate/isopropylmalate dehydrogenase
MINPMATILSTAMMLEYLGMRKRSELIHNAVKKCIKERQVTPDLGGTLTTQEVTEAILKHL